MKFIRLSKVILNPNAIKRIDLKPENKSIDIISNHNNLSGFCVAGSGGIFDRDSVISFAEKNDLEDYNKILKWIEENSE